MQQQVVDGRAEHTRTCEEHDDYRSCGGDACRLLGIGPSGRALRAVTDLSNTPEIGPRDPT